MAIEQVILLGAGASKSEGDPIQKDLIRKFFEFVNNTRNNDLREFSNALHDINEYFSEFWGISFDNCPNSSSEFPTFEECLGILDVARIRNETFRGFSRDRLLKIRNSLIFLIAKILDEKLKRGGKHHRRLVERLRRERLLLNTAFISLNYDILIDNALISLYDSCHIDYAIDLANYYEYSDFERPIPEKSVQLLKMHGSLNWLLCPTCMQILRTPRKATKAFYLAEACQKCGSIMEPIIIPPTFYKELSNFYIQEIMLKAITIFRNVRQIIFCGYSFSDADMHIKYLLKQAEQYRVHTPDIFICNGGSNDEEMLRYNRFFKEKNRIVHTNSNFEEFCEQGINL